MRVSQLIRCIDKYGSGGVVGTNQHVFIRKLKGIQRYQLIVEDNSFKVYELSKAGLLQFLQEVRR